MNWRNRSIQKIRRQHRFLRFQGGATMFDRTLRRIWRTWALYDRYQRAGRLPPTIREAAALMDMPQSYSSVMFYLEVLEAWNVMESAPGKSRARRVLIPFQQWLGD